jgi:hypothetical protein
MRIILIYIGGSGHAGRILYLSTGLYYLSTELSAIADSYPQAEGQLQSSQL